MRLTLIVTLIGELHCLHNGPAASRSASSMRRTATPLMQTDRDGPFVGPRTTPLLDQVDTPSDMKGFSISELKQLSHELRWETINAVSQTGGHLGSSLGVVELTVALHFVFDAPADPIIFDVSHQVYPHKILTGRRYRMPTLRQYGGLSGFAKRSESEYDPFGAGHSTTSISAALGMAVAFEQRGLSRQRHAVAIIGDGAITGGMAYEAMNNAPYLNSRVIVIYNDNGQVSLPTGTPSAGGTAPAGSLSAYTTRLIASKPFQDFRDIAKSINKLFPKEIQEANAKLDEYARGMVTGGTLFEELGFYYIGPVDGHDLDNLVPILENVRDRGGNQPVLLHIKTEKGYGYPPAEKASDKYHGVPKFDVATGKKATSVGATPSYTAIFADTLIDIAANDRSVCAITAAMPGGTGVDRFGKRFPKRTFDVGIAEQHAVTFCAGMAVEGLKPFCAIYSTFLQRAYDQVIHDVAIQKIAVRFILDRAGLVGNDGPTHHGSFDLAYLGCIPGLAILAPSDEVELKNMVQTVYEMDDRPSCLRYPRGSALGVEKLNDLFGYDLEEVPERGEVLPIGKGRIIKTMPEGVEKGARVAILSIGTRLAPAVEAARAVEASDATIGVTVADARWMKPLDTDLVAKLVAEHDVLITIEEGSIGGFGDHVLHYLALNGMLDNGSIKVRPMVLPDKYFEAGTQAEQYEEAGLNARYIEATALKLLGRDSAPLAPVSITPSESTIA
uniref:1-deoxy-D-xylulose-5-phosphate synthase n=1 Tax=Phaeocystis antarctica TaxID=33657 RepID=A0A7S0HD10_9EUKA|mmetsp:Transcript_12894/g.30408  ORF Transcript_12894/g.30408 Transcript_12894/m.30408 type:complete len:728 (+) Transcript_12894:77-2260(+)